MEFAETADATVLDLLVRTVTSRQGSVNADQELLEHVVIVVSIRSQK